MHPSRTARGTLAVLLVGVLVTLSGCSGSSPGSSPAPSASSSAKAARHRVEHRRKNRQPTGPPMLLQGIAPLSGTTVGVAMPISITFSDPVDPSARRRVEEAITLRTSRPVSGAWHWFGDQRVDFRPRQMWQPGTKVSVVAAFDHVGDGHGRYGTHSYTRDFTIGADVRTHVYVRQHETVVTRGGQVIRRMPSDAGSPTFPSWDGTMAVVDTEPKVRMTSRSVHIACSKKDPNYYDVVLPWDVRVTSSGTFLHYSPGDPYPGHSYGSHGCVHLSWTDAQWYYHLSKQGDPVTITGSPRGVAAGDNGYADYDVPWSQWLTGSGRQQFTTASLTS